MDTAQLNTNVRRHFFRGARVTMRHLGLAIVGACAISFYPGLGAYCAAVEVHAKEGFVLHRVEVDKTPT